MFNTQNRMEEEEEEEEEKKTTSVQRAAPNYVSASSGPAPKYVSSNNLPAAAASSASFQTSAAIVGLGTQDEEKIVSLDEEEAYSNVSKATAIKDVKDIEVALANAIKVLATANSIVASDKLAHDTATLTYNNILDGKMFLDRINEPKRNAHNAQIKLGESRAAANDAKMTVQALRTRLDAAKSHPAYISAISYAPQPGTFVSMIDNERITVDDVKPIANISRLVREVMETCIAQNDPVVVDLVISSTMIKLLIELAKWNTEKKITLPPKPLTSTKLEQVFPDKRIRDLVQHCSGRALREMLYIANGCDCPILMSVVCARIAIYIVECDVNDKIQLNRLRSMLKVRKSKMDPKCACGDESGCVKCLRYFSEAELNEISDQDRWVDKDDDLRATKLEPTYVPIRTDTYASLTDMASMHNLSLAPASSSYGDGGGSAAASSSSSSSASAASSSSIVPPANMRLTEPDEDTDDEEERTKRSKQ